jgi:putative ABC transport system permease protein
MVLTESTAKKLFGTRNPIGKIITLETQLQSNNEYKVTGVIKDLSNSHIDIDALMSLSTIDELQTRVNYNFAVSDRFWNANYLLLADDTDPDFVEGKINAALSELNDGSIFRDFFKRFHLQSLKDLYLFGTAVDLEYSKRGNGTILQSFVIVSIIVLALAIINYVNLTTARSTLRVKEISLKKVMGSSKWLLRTQFFTESILITFIAFLLSITAIQLVMPQFNQMTGVNISLLAYHTPFYWIMSFILLVIIGFVAGFYPTMKLASFSSQATLHNISLTESGGFGLRRLMLMIQFSISIMLIIGIITNWRQMGFVKNSSLGFNKDQVLMISTPWNFEDQYQYRESLKERLIQYQNIKQISFCNKRFGSQQPGLLQLSIDGLEKDFQHFSIDPDYLELMEIELLEGRNFDWARPGDRMSNSNNEFKERLSVIINETAAERYWDKSPVNKTFIHSRGAQIEIVGVFKDFHFRSMHHRVEPMILSWRDFRENMLVKVSPNNMQSTIKTIENEWKKVYGSEPFAYSFLDEAYDQQYKSDERATTIIGYFTILAITIACMGLFGLSSFMAVRRTKEIGIRKALGASSALIFIMLSREYIKWILLSSIIASPVAWYTMSKWLETFAYHIELGPGVFILAAVIVLAIGLITVGWQALKSAVANPVEALRYE